MMLPILRGAALVLMIAALTTAAAALRRGPEQVEFASPPRKPESPAQFQGDLTRLLQFARRTTPFRLGGRLPLSRYGLVPIVAQAAPPPAPKPALALTGVLVGAESAAIVEGMPGEVGAVVVHPGETRGALRIVSVDAKRVVVRGLDTTWTLEVRQPWR